MNAKKKCKRKKEYSYGKKRKLRPQNKKKKKIQGKFFKIEVDSVDKRKLSVERVKEKERVKKRGRERKRKERVKEIKGGKMLQRWSGREIEREREGKRQCD